jgi:nucleotide-binding universal stress UspA family protein
MGSALRYGDDAMIPQTILFPTDFSGRCDRARDRAVQLAGQWGARLVLFHVLNEPDAAALADERRKYEAAAHDRLKAEVQDKTIAVETRLASGSVAQAILDAADQCAADLIVTGISRHDDIGDFIVGTTVERVIRQARQPVLVVKERVEQHYSRLKVATDFSDCSGLALRTAAAVFPTAEITLVHAYQVRLEALRGREGPAAAQQAEIAFELEAFLDKIDLPEATRVQLDINVDYGEVCQVAGDHARYSKSDLAVIGTHGRSALTTAVLGSTARALLGCLDCDVLLVRQPTGTDHGARGEPSGK